MDQKQNACFFMTDRYIWLPFSGGRKIVRSDQKCTYPERLERNSAIINTEGYLYRKTVCQKKFIHDSLGWGTMSRSILGTSN